MKVYTYKYNKTLKSNARNLRRNQSDVEAILWSKLRYKQLEGVKFRRQFPIGKYILDFYCDRYKLAIELDGGQHDFDINKRYDKKKEEFLMENKIKTIRFWNNEIYENLDGVIEKIALSLLLLGGEKEEVVN